MRLLSPLFPSLPSWEDGATEPSAPHSWLFASKSWCPSPFGFRRADLLRRCLRGFCLAAGLWYAWASITAELKMAQVFSGREMEPSEFRALADGAVARFPFDRDLRVQRYYIRKELDHAVAQRSGFRQSP